MATKLLLLCGLLLVNSSDLSKGHVSAKSLNTTPDASKFLDNQTDLMEAEIDQPVQWTNMTFVNSNLLSSPDKPQENGTDSCLFINLTKCSMGQTKQQATSKSAVFDFEDPAGLDCVGADQSLEEKPDHLYENYDTINSSSNFSGIRSLNSTLKQFKNEHIGISTGDISGSMPQMNSFRPDVTLTFTCKGRCGMEILFPCSCSASCVVYGTCCDNMTQDCPHIWEEGMTRFDNLLRAYTICYENFVYMISSCPKSPRKNADRKEVIIPTTREPVLKNVRNISESQSPIFDTVVTTSDTKDVIGLNSAEFSRSGGDIQESIVEKLRNILSAAPVTDSDTGFTFINKSIYDCNNMSQNNALTWSVESAYTVISLLKWEIWNVSTYLIITSSNSTNRC
ncbi:hypothetical protein PoB_007087700 [Plakobranchus ocellatus]|uniref:SMB domain-containing protein n=1 Tax=Plakobranchus ocellatus TaxID=259542 RepID=A0AAV4DJB9_9GAST|nr:hypothetical protein PoB_007087700 [Plakobranchus ocellatus]